MDWPHILLLVVFLAHIGLLVVSLVIQHRTLKEIEATSKARSRRTADILKDAEEILKRYKQ